MKCKFRFFVLLQAVNFSKQTADRLFANFAGISIVCDARKEKIQKGHKIRIDQN